jgi:hypothetical protein
LQPQIALFDPRGNLRSPVINDLQKQGVIGSVTTFDELSQAVRDLRLKGRTASGDPKLDLNGRQARDYAEQLSQEVSDGLATVSSGLAKRYREMDQRYGQGAEMLRFLKQPGLVDEDGKLNMKVLQEAFKEERRSGIERRFTPAQVKELSDAIFRGAPATATDVMKRASYSGGVGESAQIGKYRIFGNLMDKLGGGNPYAGKYDLPAPYVTPKTAGLAAQRVGGGIGYALDRPISLTAPDEETP